MEMIKKYRAFIILVAINIVLAIFNLELGVSAAGKSVSNFFEMIKVLPPIFILIGLFDVWVPREVLIKYMGEKSGLVGILLAFFLGSFTAGPLYAAFPVALILMKKGSRFSNVLIFIGAWSTTKIPLILFEATSLGFAFTLTRLVVNIVGILVMAFIVEKTIGKKGKEKIYSDAELVSA